MVGAGTVSLTDHADRTFSLNDKVFVAVPAFNLMLNISRRITMTAGGSYRFVVDSDFVGVSDSDLSGPAFIFEVRFGKF